MTLVLPDGVPTLSTPQPVPPPILRPAEESSATKEEVKSPQQAKTHLETAADQMFGDRSPAGFESNGNETPEHIADGM